MADPQTMGWPRAPPCQGRAGASPPRTLPRAAVQDSARERTIRCHERPPGHPIAESHDSAHQMRAFEPPVRAT